MESSSRMRQCLRRNYRGSNHYGAAASHEDGTDRNQEKKNIIDPSGAHAFSADAISVDFMNDDDEQEPDKLHGNDDHGPADQPRLSGSTEQADHISAESTDIQLTSDQDLVGSSSAVAPGYVPSQLDERILLELPSSMVRLLRVVRGTFQVHS